MSEQVMYFMDSDPSRTSIQYDFSIVLINNIFLCIDVSGAKSWWSGLAATDIVSVSCRRLFSDLHCRVPGWVGSACHI